MEEHYVFKSLFEDKITEVSSIGAERWGLCWNACATRGTFSGVRTVRGRRLLVDSGCSSPELCDPIQYFLVCWNLSIPPDVKMSSKNTLHYSNGIIVFKKRFHTNARCPSNQRCMMTEGFKPLYPVMCVSSHRLQICRHGAKFKSSNYLCLTLYKSSLEADSFSFIGGWLSKCRICWCVLKFFSVWETPATI
jgi:hypothetical protein